MTEPILKGRGLTKRYGRVTALDNCDFELAPGEIMAVIGDNGAGKSTLIKALSGAVIPGGETYQRATYSAPCRHTLPRARRVQVFRSLFQGRIKRVRERERGG